MIHELSTLIFRWWDHCLPFIVLPVLSFHILAFHLLLGNTVKDGKVKLSTCTLLSFILLDEAIHHVIFSSVMLTSFLLRSKYSALSLLQHRQFVFSSSNFRDQVSHKKIARKITFV